MRRSNWATFAANIPESHIANVTIILALPLSLSRNLFNGDNNNSNFALHASNLHRPLVVY